MDTRTPELIEANAERDAKLVKLRREGATFQEIGDKLGFSRQYAHRRYWELIKEHPAAEVHEYRAEALDRLDWLRREAVEILRAEHVVVSQGRVMYETQDDGTKTRLLDSAPKIQALRELRQIEELQANLVGSKAPVKTDVSGETSVKVVLVGVDVEAIG
jgi:hypothetical protein